MSGRARRRIGVGVIGFGWLGQAHSRSLLRIPTLFGERAYDPRLVACSDALPARVDAGELVRLPARDGGLARGGGGPRRRGGVDRRAQHGPR